MSARRRRAPTRLYDRPLMVADTIRLLLFPAMMAFAASSDLLTMTISNRVSLILVGGFFVMAAGDRDERHRRCSGMWQRPRSFLSSRLAFSRGAGSAAAMPSSRPRPRLWLGFDHLMPYLSMHRCSAAR